MTQNPTARAEQSVLFEFVVTCVLLLPAFLLFRTSISGDASIYFTFIKNLASLPFSFQPQTVNFGATSPIHVLLHAPAYMAFGNNWLPVSKAINFMLIVVGIVLLNRAVVGNYSTLILISALTLMAKPLLVATGQLYESGLAFLSVSLVYYLLKRRHFWQAVLVAGSLYLIRPELLVVTVAVDAYLFITSKKRLRCACVIMLSLTPTLAYHAYMFFHTGQLIPSSVLARTIRALEEPATWVERSKGSLSQLAGLSGLTYLVGTIALMALSARRVRLPIEEILLFLPLLLVFVAVPPHGYLARYLLPITPIAVVSSAMLGEWLWRSFPSVLKRAIGRRAEITDQRIRRSLALFAIMIAVMIYLRYLPEASNRRYDYDTLLLKDLPEQLNAIAGPQQKVVIYEIQAQYYLSAFCISLDCTVGNSMLAVYRGHETFADFVEREAVNYVVTMNSFNYRRAFDNTLLEELYVHDLSSNIGDVFTSGRLSFRKILTNRAFSDPNSFKLRPWDNLNVGDELRVYGESAPLWINHHPLWNSVYEVSVLDSSR
jgi:hypothetical protein